MNEFNVSSAQIGGQLTGQQLRIGAGDIDVAIHFHAEGIDAFFPAVRLLDFVKEQIDLAAHSGSALEDLVMQYLRRTQMAVAHIFKVDRDTVLGRNPVGKQLLPNRFQHDRLAAAAHACHHLDEIAADKWPNPIHIAFA